LDQEFAMPRQRDSNSSNAKNRGTKPGRGKTASPNGTSQLGWFTWFAHETARLAGRPSTFLLATLMIVVWGLTGPIFHFSDTWQLVINTGTTIITFLMVFLIQNTQNRDTMALQIKLAELIIAVHGAHNRLAAAEDMCDEDLEALHQAYRSRAEETLESLEKRRARLAAAR
jgi:low affinity Fe/Cu permease